MSASPVLFDPAPSLQRPAKGRVWKNGWLGVFCALIFIRFTSTTFMGGSHTQIVLNAVWKTFLGHWHWDLTGPVNEYCRKVGHFIGYGLVSLIFRNAWARSAQAFAWVSANWLSPFAASLAVASTFTVACLDELHQTFLPGRVGSIHDAVLDASGAIVLNGIFWVLAAHSRTQLRGSERVVAQSR